MLFRSKQIAGVFEVTPENDRRSELRDDRPRGLRGFGTVEGIRVGDAFANTGRAFTVHADEEERSLVDPPEARFEKPDQRQAHEPQLEPLDSHRTML